MSEILLGKSVQYKSSYDKSLLFPIKRSVGRAKSNITDILPFQGYDLWNCYEVSWLNSKGKPEVRIMHFTIPATSECLIESKSIKLYLNSFNNTKFYNESDVIEIIKTDLSKAACAQVEVIINNLNFYNNSVVTIFAGMCLDDLDVEIVNYDINSDILSCVSKDIVSETLYSNLLKSNCLVTGQPDWASILIKYKGPKINKESLLKYLISYRNHNGFHEECIEHIFSDLMNKCKPSELSIFAKYTRRGGVDINPFRSNLDLKNTEVNKTRDVRQ